MLYLTAALTICLLLGLIYAVSKLLERPVQHLGNFVVEFFASRLTKRPSRCPTRWTDRLGATLEPELVEFYRRMPYAFTLEPAAQGYRLECEARSAWEPARCGPDYAAFWESVAPSASKVLDEALSGIDCVRRQDRPVIHFRCSDVPFIMSEVYHLQRFEYYAWALERLASLGIDCARVLLVTDSAHRSTPADQAAASEYQAALERFLSARGVEVETQRGTTLEDFSTMFYAPALIGAASSLSFAAGLSKLAAGTYLCPKLGVEDGQSFRSPSETPAWMHPKAPLLHGELRRAGLSYHEVEEVVKLLESSR